LTLYPPKKVAPPLVGKSWKKISLKFGISKEAEFYTDFKNVQKS
jgi:hypothetical protein